MGWSETVFGATGAVGFLLLLVSLLLGEAAGTDHDAELGHELGHDLGHDVGEATGTDVAEAPNERSGEGDTGLHRPSWRSFRVLAASAVGFGTAGLVATQLGLPALLSWPIAIAGCGLMGAGVYRLVVKPLAQQQYNSLLSRYSYLGRHAVVTVEILPGGSGQVTFTDRQGARVVQRATSDTPEGVLPGTPVEIVELAEGGVVVHRNAFTDQHRTP